MALKDHNLEAYNATKNMLMTYNECCLVAGTGIGKSNISTELINELKLNTLVIAPTNSIKDNWANMQEEYDIPPMISTVSYKLFSANPEVFKGFDMYIFDECHHIGSKVWGTAVKSFKESLENGEYVLGLTADSIRYLDYEAEIKDVAYSVFDGHVVYGLDTKEAIELGVLPKATYICALYNAKEYIEKYENMDMTQELRGRLALTKQNCESIETITNRHTPKDVPLKGIVFVDSIGNIKSGVDLVKSCFPGYEVNSVHSKMRNSKDILDMFKNAKSGFMVSVNMISEGMHFTGINTIIMLRKTQSPSLYIQQIGRGLVSGGQDVVIFDFVRNDMSIKKVLEQIEAIKSLKWDINNSDGKSGINRNFIISNQNIDGDYATDILSVLNDIDIYASSKRKWTKEEDDIIKKNYPTIGTDVYSMLQGRTRAMCRARARRINVIYGNKWSDDEDNIIRKYYPTMGSDVSNMLKGRTREACKRRASNLGIKNVRKGSWTKEEDDIIRKYYPTMGNSVCDKLTRRSKDACVSRASYLNVKFDNGSWSEEEINIIRKYYPTMGGNVTSMLPGRSRRACRVKAYKLDVVHDGNKWTKEEDDIIKEYYPTMGGNVASMLPGRSKDACTCRSVILNVKYNNDNIWTKEEDDIIRKYYPTMGGRIISKLPGRTRDTCVYRAHILRVKYALRWTRDELNILKKYYPSIGTKVADMLPNKTADACRDKASKLKIEFCENNIEENNSND